MKTIHLFKMLSLISILMLSACSSSKSRQLENGVSVTENPDYLTAINIVTPKEGEQQKIVDLLDKGMKKYMSKVPGFINATVHQSQDNDYVAVYAQWKDQEALDAAVAHIQAGNAPPMMQVFTEASPDFHPYQVIASIPAAGSNNEVNIRENVSYLTAINIVTPKNGEQDKIVGLLREGMLNSMRNVAGFRNATIHKSLDNEYVAVYAQWDSQDALNKAVEFIQAGNAPAMLDVFTDAQADFHPYEIISVTKAQ